MSKHPEHEGKTAAHDKPHDNRAEEATPAPPPAPPSKLKRIAHYALLGFAPAMSILALLVAVTAFNHSQSSQEQFSKIASQSESLNATLATYKSELERLNVAMAQLKDSQQDERRKREMQVAEIIQSVTRMQTKMKIFPTLEDVLYVPPAPAAANGNDNDKKPAAPSMGAK
ncbi:MAG: hypothetical protein HY306_11725 [Nitrosomonadales bacterium]|nr:hypothetical protein [Nitrosomonadales bacterium]